ncbi:conserved hypothetical protein [uncultured Desulfobacterium sp.]|uniref:Mor transcription activator domain-containing protein n=1 Tax=uncultured Desulfobacterium sp. TaxID=201089 RepID=A0A445MWD7_9BACT|nr:conserved hypothetical protein [uncultured Desulfobacterium sp.]
MGLIEDDIQLEDLPEELRDMADIIGFDDVLALVRNYGGAAVYINEWETVARGARNRRIRKDFNGVNYKELAREHKLTVSAIRQILDEGKESRSKQEQMGLFE